MIKPVCCLNLWLLGELASAAAPAPNSDYAYRAQAHDTLIGLRQWLPNLLTLPHLKLGAL